MKKWNNTVIIVAAIIVGAVVGYDAVVYAGGMGNQGQGTMYWTNGTASGTSYMICESTGVPGEYDCIEDH